jgi:hypothetical protein
MTAPALLLPGSRVLLGWWRELAPLQPRRLWFASLLTSRLEALVEGVSVTPLEPLQFGLLRLLARTPPHEPLPPLYLADRWLAALFQELATADLVRQAGANWELTETGRSVQEQGAYLHPWRGRRVFHFLPDNPVRYLPLLRQAGTPLPAWEGWTLDPLVLEAFVRQPDAWKVRHYFPPEVKQFLGTRAGEANAEPDPERVLLIGPEQVLLALVQVSAEPSRPSLLGFPVKADGWVLDGSSAALALPEGWAEVLPGLADEAPREEWRRAWQAWCHPRGLPPAEVDACQLEAVDHRLLVRAPARLVERLRTSRSDALKGEAWLLAGSGRSRQAGLIELSE